METVNQDANTQDTNTQAPEKEPERTFTQAEMDAVIGDRLARERAKYADYNDLKAKAQAYDAAQEADKSDLQKATERADALEKELNALKTANQERELKDKVSAETGVPASLLRGSTEDELKAQAQAILDFAKPQKGYPAVKDAGEVTKVSGGSTRDQFKDWFNDALGK